MADDDGKTEFNKYGYSVEELYQKFSFEVPIYQRVFTWGNEQIERLFKDLKEHFSSSNKRYYLGVITVVRQKDNNKLVLVDGQQRLTCILLLGALLNWNLNTDKLTYAARPRDEEALKRVYSICKGCNVVRKMNIPSFEEIATIGNDSMSGFLRYALTASKGLENLESLQRLQENNVINIKQRLTLMVSFLPDDPYKTNLFEQNRYFEKMNYGGKQLEPHEILKVRMCDGLNGKYLGIWNAVANFGKCYDPTSSDRREDSNEGKCNKHSLKLSDVLDVDNPSQNKDCFQSTIYDQCNNKEQLRQYEMGAEKRDDMRQGLISFQTFLLHVRCLYLKNEALYGDDSRLLELFGKLVKLQPKERGEFVELMAKYRQFLDTKIIHVKNVEGESRYYFYKKDEDGFRDLVPDDQKDMVQFQSMLYVSSGDNQEWLLWAYKKYGEGVDETTVDKFTVYGLARKVIEEGFFDASTREVILKSTEWLDDWLKYGTNNRRWFALLDYLIWKELSNEANKSLWGVLKCSKFVQHKDKIRSAIDNYIFRKNRSVEHLHAQTDDNATEPEEWKKNKDIFGNLALISAGRNSEYGNLSVGGKFDRVVKLLIEGGDKGSKIESIKLLFMLAMCNGADAEWTVDKARQHANEMLKLFQQFLSTPGASSRTDTISECPPIDLSYDFDALGKFIEQKFFGGKLPSDYSMCVISGNDAESPNKWCGRYFKIVQGEMEIRAWVGWLYGVGSYKDSPRFVIQLAEKNFHTLPGSGRSGWYLDPFWKKWMEKKISNNLSDMTSIAKNFQQEMELLCTSD